MLSTKQTLTYVAVALLAGATGALVAVFFAPVSGREARRVVARRVEDEKDVLERRGRRAVEDARDYVRKKIDRGKEAISEVISH